MTCGAYPPDDLFWIVDASKNGRNKITEFHPAIGRLEDLWRCLQTVPDFRPEPLRGINVPAFGDVLGAVFGGESGYFSRFNMTSVILPKPTLGGEVFLPFSVQSEWNITLVDGQRA